MERSEKILRNLLENTKSTVNGGLVWWENPMVGIFQGIFQDYDMYITHARRMVFGITEHIVFVPRWARIMASAPATSDPTEISTDLGCVGYCPLVNSPDSA